MADSARPALAEVLAAITDRPVGHWRAELRSPAFVGIERISSSDVQWTVRLDPYRSTTQTRRASLRSAEPAYEARRVGNTLMRVEVAPAHTITPAEALEALATARLWPWEPRDAAAPRWWCAFLNDAIVDDPPSLADLVSVASLGAPQLARYAHLAGEIARAAGCAGARVVWRVMPREKITEHHRARHTSTAWLTSAPSLTEVFTTEEMLHIEGGSSWRRACDWGDSTARAAWPALRSLAVGDEATPQPTGVHLVDLDASRIVLAVEAIGGPRG